MAGKARASAGLGGRLRRFAVHDLAGAITLGFGVHIAAFAGHDHGHGQAQALGGQHVAPILDELAVSAADITDVSVKVVEAQRIDMSVPCLSG